jgi:hypothetical protein
MYVEDKKNLDKKPLNKMEVLGWNLVRKSHYMKVDSL